MTKSYYIGRRIPQQRIIEFVQWDNVTKFKTRVFGAKTFTWEEARCYMQFKDPNLRAWPVEFIDGKVHPVHGEVILDKAEYNAGLREAAKKEGSY